MDIYVTCGEKYTKLQMKKKKILATTDCTTVHVLFLCDAGGASQDL